MENLAENKYSNTNYIYFNSTEKTLRFCSFKNYNLTLSFENIILKNYISVSVFLKNIKTRELFKCFSTIENDSIIINLKSLNDLCTNYEFSIIIILEDHISYTTIYPKLKGLINIDESIISSSNNSNIQWYLRFLENGKLRLSTIYLFSNLNKGNTKKIIL